LIFILRDTPALARLLLEELAPFNLSLIAYRLKNVLEIVAEKVFKT